MLYSFARPWLHLLDPEAAHALTLRALQLGLVPAQPAHDEPILAIDLFGTRLPNPLGLAAGFDKNALVYQRMFAQGFSFVEVGGVTPRPQAGNARPRVFRLPEDGAVINRMGFPNDGAKAIAARMRSAGRLGGIVGVNLAANADSEDPADDFVKLVRQFAPFAHYLVLDISCPNTENGQLFLDPQRLAEMLERVNAVLYDGHRVPLWAKLSPDVAGAQLEALVGVLTAARVDGLIVSNTTRERPALRNAARDQAGGLSGRPLFASSTRLLAEVRSLTKGTVPLIGVGGVASGADAYEKIRAGAHAVQLYTALIYRGTDLVTEIKRELASLLRRDGFTSVSQAVGTNVHGASRST
ncbi:MAG TPA: quinone-dependent dihydroorotate dehydrogenase [Candidatus Acidoferrales bacterium]|nr:quinone-dependent dihydroorotate dehydrogenase [Candidatus Acidoferrales bacterium]